MASSLKSSKLAQMALLGALVSHESVVVHAADWPNAGNINDLSGGSTPKNTVRAIKADQPYNAD